MLLSLTRVLLLEVIVAQCTGIGYARQTTGWLSNQSNLFLILADCNESDGGRRIDRRSGKLVKLERQKTSESQPHPLIAL